jgi:putative MATE family efflux protein
MATESTDQKKSGKLERQKLLGEMPVARALLRLAVPASIGMAVMALYNIVDTIFVGKGVGSLGIAGVAVVFPLQMILLGIAQIFGLGGASIVSRALGAKDHPLAERTLGNVFTLSIIVGVVITVLGLIFKDPVLTLFGADEKIYTYASDYYEIILLGSVPLLLALGLNNIIRAEGDAKTAMITMLISSCINIVLDPILIFESFTLGGTKIPLAGMGVRGAAIATVIAQSTTMIYVTAYFFFKRSVIHFQHKSLLLQKNVFTEMMAIGLAAFSRQASGSVMIAIVNNSLNRYGTFQDIAVFGILFKILMFTFLPILGIMQGFLPIAGFNYGSKNITRVRSAISYSIYYTTATALVGAAVAMLIPGLLFSLFTNEEYLLSEGVIAMRTIFIMFPTLGFQVIVAGMYQAFGKPLQSLVISLTRSVIFLIPLLLLLPLHLGLRGIWIAFPAADFCAFFATLVFFIFEIRYLSKITT